MAVNVDMKINRLPHTRDKGLKGDILNKMCYFFRLLIVKKGKVTPHHGSISDFTSNCIIFAVVTTVICSLIPLS